MIHTMAARLAQRGAMFRQVQLVVKRLFDLAFASVALLALLPLLAVLALVICLESPGPAIFRQQRLGRNGKPFTLYKLRTMRNDAPMQFNADGSTRVVANDPRVTRLGAWLRRTAIDELPQLFNVLRGDMSLVGPRPDPAFYLANYNGKDFVKLQMRPGLTALAHVLGRQTIGWRERFAIERCYIVHYSLWLDVKILLLTLLVIWRGIGVTNDPGSTAQPASIVHPWFRTVLHHHPTHIPDRSGPMSHFSSRHGPVRRLSVFVCMALLLSVAGVSGSVASAQSIRRISPVLECIIPHDDGSYTAFFGYSNRNDFVVDFPVGPDNRFSPAPEDRGQPTSFLPGRHYKAFAVEVSNGNLVWRLPGKSATASPGSKVCSPGTTADFNGDGAPDLLWRNQLSGANSIWAMNGPTRSAVHNLNTVPDGNWRIVGVHDIDNDQTADIFWRHAESGQIIIWRMAAAARWGLAGLNTVGDLDWQIVGFNDFNGDNRLDILWRHAQSGTNIIWYLQGPVRSGLSALNTVSDTGWQIAGLHDFDDAGSADIIWRHAQTGDNVIWFMDDQNRLSVMGTLRVSDPRWLLVGAGDVDGDQRADLFWRNTDTGANVLWLMNGAEIGLQVNLNAVSEQDWQIASIADYDGDGKADLLWRNSITGAGAIWHLDGTGRRAVTTLNTVGEAGWRISGTQLRPVETRTAGPVVTAAERAAFADGAALLAAAPMPDEPPGEPMAVEGISQVMPDEPIGEIPPAMLAGAHVVYLALVQR